MKSKKIRTLRIIAICFCSCLLFVATGYFYLQTNMEKTENYTSEIPYSSEVPQNAGILLDICGSRTFFYMDFENKDLYIMIPEDIIESSSDIIYGYPVDFRINADYSLLAEIIDFIDGIEMMHNGETLRFTGVQITDMLSRTNDSSELKRNIILKIIEKIGSKGFEKKNFVYIIENSETNLTVPDCYFWSEYIMELCRNGRIIN